MGAKTVTYTREVYRFLDREELRTLLKRAHEECKREVPLTVHQTGKKRSRTVQTRKRDEYLACIKRKIYEELAKRIPPGVKVEIPELAKYVKT
jgi:hypothetical protein